MDSGAGTGISMKMECVTKENGVPPPTGVAVMRNPGRVVPSAGAATPVTRPVFLTVAIVAIAGSTASNVYVADTVSPFWATRAVAKSCVWKPGGKVVDELLTSIQPIAGVLTVTATEADLVMPLSTAVAVMLSGVELAATPVTLPV